MEGENQETYLLPEVAEEGIPSPHSAVPATHPVPIIGVSAEAKHSQAQSDLGTIVVDPASGQHGQAIYVTLGPEEQVLQVLNPSLVQAPVKQSTLTQDVDTTQQAQGQSTMGAAPLVSHSVAQSPLLLVQAPAASLPQAQSNQKGKKGTRRSVVAGTSSKQTVRSLLEQKSAPTPSLSSELVPNVTVLSHNPTLGERLQLSAATASRSTPESDVKPSNMLSLLTQSKTRTNIQGVAVPDLNKFIATQQGGHQIKPSSPSGKKPTKRAASPGGIVQTKVRPLIPILPAPQGSDVNIEPVFTVPAADAQLIGALPDPPQLLTQPGGLMSLPSDLDGSKQILSVPQVQYVQPDGKGSVAPTQEPLLLHRSGTTGLHGTAPAVDLNTIPEENTGFTAPAETGPFEPTETFTLAEHGQPLVCKEDQQDLVTQSATDLEPQTAQQQTAAAAELLSVDTVTVEALEKRVELEPQMTEVARAEAVTGSETSQTDVSLVPEAPAQVENLQRQQFCQIFSEMKARVSRSLIDALPGVKSASLVNLAKENNLDVLLDDQTFTVCGDIHNLVTLHTACLELLDTASKCVNFTKETKPKAGTCDKELMCELLKPQYSRSGRQLKWQTMDSRYDDLVQEDKPKQGRVPRVLKCPKAPPSRKVKQKKSEPDVLQKAVETLLEKGDQNVESEDPDAVTCRASSSPKTAQQTTNIKTEDHSTDAAETCTTPDHNAAVDSMSKVDDPSVGKDSEKENKDDKTAVAVKAEGVGAVQLLESAEGLQLGRRKKHKKNYEKETPFKFFCNKCSFKTIRSSHYDKHMQYHNEDLPLLKCTKCDFKTIRRSHLTKHQMIHSKVSYECPVCKYKTDDRMLLTRHYKAKHKPETTKHCKELSVFSCPHCSYKTLRLYLYNRHLKCHSSVSESSETLTHTYQCDVCPYKTQRKEHYCRHKSNVHEKKRPHLCDLCGKAFKRKDALKQHKVLHADKSTRIYPYKCPDPQCKKAFSSRGHLKDHMTIHSNIRAYLCEICGASFKTSSVQRKHVQTVHNNPRRFPCHKCDKRFNTKYSLRRHLATHDTPGMRALQDTGNSMMLTETGEVGGVLEQLHVTQDEDVQKIHIIQPQQIIEVGSVVEQSVEGVMEAGQQVVIATASEALAGVQTIEETYEQVTTDGTEQSTLVHANEASTALYYLTSFHSYES